MNNCNKHVGCVDKSDRMADSYRLSCRLGGNGQKSCVFYLIDVSALNAFVLQKTMAVT